MKQLLRLTACCVTLVTLFAGNLARAEYRDMPMSTGMVGWTTNYTFRGETYSSGMPVVQAGLQFSGPYYFGVLGSQIHDGTSSGTGTEFYVGIKDVIGGRVGIDIGGITHQYAGTSYPAFSEYYAGLIIGPARIAYYNEVTNASNYIDFSFKVGNRNGSLLLVHWGKNTTGNDMKLSLSQRLAGIRFSAIGVYEDRGTASTSIMFAIEKFF